MNRISNEELVAICDLTEDRYRDMETLTLPVSFVQSMAEEILRWRDAACVHHNEHPNRVPDWSG